MKLYFFFIFVLVTLTNCAQLPLSIERADSGHIRGEDAADPNSRGISLNKWINDEISKSLSINNDNLINNKEKLWKASLAKLSFCLLYTSPSPRDRLLSRMPSSA